VQWNTDRRPFVRYDRSNVRVISKGGRYAAKDNIFNWPRTHSFVQYSGYECLYQHTGDARHIADCDPDTGADRIAHADGNCRTVAGPISAADDGRSGSYKTKSPKASAVADRRGVLRPVA